jgi:ribose/xylose/arabinose/galactoside ABC-type transport system permease subunit
MSSYSRGRQSLRGELFAKRSIKLSREAVLLVVLVVELFVLGYVVPGFSTVSNLLDVSRFFVEFGLVALGMTLVIITGGIDLSVGSAVALVSVAIGFSFHAGLPLPLAIVLGMMIGVLGGVFNGVLITGLRLPPLTVTLGTLALFRGIAYAVSGAGAVSSFPLWFTVFGQSYAGPIPVQLLIFIVVACAMALVLSHTRFGRYVKAIGLNQETARFSGVPVERVTLAVYVLMGLLVSLAALIYTSRVFTARANAGFGMELAAITAVVFGGASITGGSGTILGTVLAVLVLTFLQNGLIFASVPTEWGTVVIGLALIVGVLINESLRHREE